jgi:transcriptional regulator GlxA family with amidase domain
MEELALSPTPSFPATIRIGILVFPDFEPLDVWGFCQAFSIARFLGTSYGGPPPYPFELVLVTNETRPAGDGSAVPRPVRSYNGPRVAPDVFRDDALAQRFDVLMIPGGLGVASLLARQDHPDEVEALLAWTRAMDGRVSLMTSVCTGAAVLAAAGLLDSLPAATNHQAFAWVAQFGPRVRWDNIQRWVDAGRYVTSAGVSAGTDMAFHLVARLAGRAVAETAVLAAEYDWHRDPEKRS